MNIPWIRISLIALKETLLCLIILNSIGVTKAQDSHLDVSPVIFEIGLGYPITFENTTQYLDSYIHLGNKIDINKNVFGGHMIFVNGRYGSQADYVFGSKLRLGKIINTRSNLSFDLGLPFYSSENKSFPGYNLGLNYNKTNKFGVNMRYDQYYNKGNIKSRDLILSLNIQNSNALKIGTPIIGSIAGIYGILVLMISQSR